MRLSVRGSELQDKRRLDPALSSSIPDTLHSTHLADPVLAGLPCGANHGDLASHYRDYGLAGLQAPILDHSPQLPGTSLRVRDYGCA